MIDHTEGWIAWMRSQQRSPKTIKKYRQHVRGLLDWLGDGEPTVETLYAYRLHRQRDQRRKPATIRADFTAIYDYFTWLETNGHATGLPGRGSVKLPAIGEQDAPCPTDWELQEMFDVATGSPTHTERACYLRGRKLGILAILAGSGLRLQELLALNVSDIDRSGSPWIVTVVCGKGAQAGAVEFLEVFEPFLGEWLAARARWCFRHQHHSDALFPVDSVRRLAERGLYAIWAEMVSQCEITWRFTPHCLRRWFGSKVQETVDLATAQAMLRHKRIATTLKYLKTNPEKRRRAAQSIRLALPAEFERERTVPAPSPAVRSRTNGRVRRTKQPRRVR